MLINGEKYACEACVRGHRVSSCTHSDRKLLHVNKKGRPVSQCQHCRSLRKARSQHVRCECQDKAHAKEDCPHLKNENGSTIENPTSAPIQPLNPAEPHICCCGHGARCTCSLKKEHSLDTVPEGFPQLLQPKEPHKPRISSLNNHEGKPTIFSNGHHKPVHKINDAHNHCGAPYRVPSRSHTVHGHREFAQRSVDSLPILKQAQPHGESPLHNTISNSSSDIRQTKSEHGSPELRPANSVTSAPSNDLYIPPLSPNAYSYSPFDSQSPTIPPIMNNQHDNHLPENIPESWFTTYDEAHSMDNIPITGYNDIPPVDWTTFDFPTMNSAFPQNAFDPMGRQYPRSFEQSNLIGLPMANSSSGDLSEVDDTHTIGNRPSNLRTVSTASNDHSSVGDDRSETYRIGSTSSYYSAPQANVLANTMDNLDIDEYVKQTVDQQLRMSSQPQSQPLPQQALPTPPSMRQSPLVNQSPQLIQSSQSPQLQQGAPQQTESPQPRPQPQSRLSNGTLMPNSTFNGEHAFTVSEAQKYAHMSAAAQPEVIRSDPVLTSLPIIEDPMWSAAPEGSTAFLLDDEREDEDWVR